MRRTLEAPWLRLRRAELPLALSCMADGLRLLLSLAETGVALLSELSSRPVFPTAARVSITGILPGDLAMAGRRLHALRVRSRSSRRCVLVPWGARGAI